MNFGGVAVGGMAGNRKHFPPSLPCVDHLRHPLDIARNAFSQGGQFGVELADELEQRIVTLRPVHHRGGDCRADARLHRGDFAAQGLSGSACAKSATATAFC